MKKVLSMALVLMMVLTLFAVPTMAAAGDNLIYNGDFQESNVDDKPAGTETVKAFSAKSSTLNHADTKIVLDGENKVLQLADTSGNVEFRTAKWSEALAAGKTYTVKLDVKPEAALGKNGVRFVGFGTTNATIVVSDNTSEGISQVPAASLWGFTDLTVGAWNHIEYDVTLTGAAPSNGRLDVRIYTSANQKAWIDNVSIAEKVTTPVLPTTATVSISGANAVTSVADETVTIGDETTFTVTPKLGYYIQSITVGGTAIDVLDAYKGGEYETGVIEENTEIVVTTAAIDTDASGTYSTDVATLPAAFATTASTVTFGKVLDANATSYGVELKTSAGADVSPYHGGGPLYKANRKTADGQYAVEFVGLAAGEYTVRTYVIVDGVKSFGAPTTFTVVE